MSVECYAAMRKGGPLEKFTYDPKPLGTWDVEVEITHCGICHSDIHLIDDDWKISSYPLVPGHEIVGSVKAKGAGVSAFRRGDRVGIGWQSGACLMCEYCLSGHENLCSSRTATCVSRHGGFAESIRVDSRFAFKIPGELPSESAGPLLCGGITVYSPLRIYGVTPPMKVGVIGIGGLGHLALQFARMSGCEVTAFSSTPAKREEAESLGAHHFISSTDTKALRKAKGSIDFLISTVFVDLAWDSYLSILKPGGRLCFAGGPPSPVSISAHQLIGNQQSVSGSNTGGRQMIKEMLEFAARHHITARSEVIPLRDVNEAIQKVRDNRVRYRVVLTI